MLQQTLQVSPRTGADPVLVSDVGSGSGASSGVAAEPPTPVPDQALAAGSSEPILLDGGKAEAGGDAAVAKAEKAVNTAPVASKSPVRSESRLAFVLSRVREGVWGGWSQPLALAEWAASRSHWVQPAAIIQTADDLREPVGWRAFIGDPREPIDWKIRGFEAASSVVIACLLAILYAKFKPSALVAVQEREDKASLDGDFKHGLCSCCETPLLACLVCFCPGIRWSDTTRMAGLLKFNTAVVVVLCIQILAPFLGAALPGLILALVGIFYRRKLRQRFSMDESSGSMVADCLKWCCCMCCTIVQEARQLEEAQLLGHDAVRSALPLKLS